ncbi:hypothetical protein C8R44DRAFT_869487 [Mycena epipterygia]|nr:hypothetical protein C8R44DRAFT_869487 [Mycena epipterygia]
MARTQAVFLRDGSRTQVLFPTSHDSKDSAPPPRWPHSIGITQCTSHTHIIAPAHSPFDTPPRPCSASYETRDGVALTFYRTLALPHAIPCLRAPSERKPTLNAFRYTLPSPPDAQMNGGGRHKPTPLPESETLRHYAMSRVTQPTPCKPLFCTTSDERMAYSGPRTSLPVATRRTLRKPQEECTTQRPVGKRDTMASITEGRVARPYRSTLPCPRAPTLAISFYVPRASSRTCRAA